MEGGLGLERAHMVCLPFLIICSLLGPFFREIYDISFADLHPLCRSDADDQGMFTELSVLYAKYRPEKRESSLLLLSPYVSHLRILHCSRLPAHWRGDHTACRPLWIMLMIVMEHLKLFWQRCNIVSFLFLRLTSQDDS
jgi:hypothetical protein